MGSPETMRKKPETVIIKPVFSFEKHPMLKSLIGFMLAWGFLNIVLTSNYPLPEKHLLAPLRVSPEALFVTGTLCAIARLKVSFHWSLYLFLTLLVLFFGA